MNLTGWDKRTRQLVIKYGCLADRYRYWEREFGNQTTEVYYLCHLIGNLEARDPLLVDLAKWTSDTEDPIEDRRRYRTQALDRIQGIEKACKILIDLPLAVPVHAYAEERQSLCGQIRKMIVDV